MQVTQLREKGNQCVPSHEFHELQALYDDFLFPETPSPRACLLLKRLLIYGCGNQHSTFTSWHQWAC